MSSRALSDVKPAGTAAAKEDDGQDSDSSDSDSSSCSGDSEEENSSIGNSVGSLDVKKKREAEAETSNEVVKRIRTIE